MYQNSCSVWGTKGRLTLSRAFSLPPTYAPKVILEQQDLKEERTIPPCDPFAGEIEAFCAGVDDEATRKSWREDALCHARVIESIRLSGKQCGASH